MASRLPRFLVLLLAAGASGCASLGFLPADAMATLKQPNHVDAFRTGDFIDHPGYGGKLDGFAVFQTGHLPPPLSRQLADLIANPATYIDKTRADEFAPSAGYRFYRRQNGGLVTLDVLVGFDSGQIMLVQHDGKQREIFRRLLVFDPAREQILDITRQAFPDDDFIQTLPLIHPAGKME
ncbi:MAG TPA: hypothetical protein VL992_12110 [Tepidisphaeraceae bacterium]|nr:hypothetical protein [Tepidisphaeraceae bacterium]